MDIKDIEKLEDFLKIAEIPEARVFPKTFLGIAKQPHYENVISNIYAFFFKDTEVHQLGDLFFSSLIELINQKRAPKNTDPLEAFGEVYVKTEDNTDKGGRIDLLLERGDLSIIIENKIYHYLNNDLSDYWDSTKTQYKAGVVLSLEKISKIGHTGFENITHFELLTAVFKNIGPYLLKADAKYLVFLKDFYQNIINITNPMNKEELEFYYKYHEKIAQLEAIKENLSNHINDQINRACTMLEKDLILGNKKDSAWRFYQSPKNSGLMFTLYFGALIEEDKQLFLGHIPIRNLLLIVELQSSLLEKIEEVFKLDFGEENRHLIQKNAQNKSWLHFAKAQYSLTDSDITHLADFIADKIQTSGLLTIFKKIESEFGNNK